MGRRFFPTVFGSSAASSHPISRGSKGIKLTTVTKSERPVKADDSSSIQQLADIEDGHSEDYGQHEHSTVHTNISSEANHTGFARRQNRVDFGIHVQKETVVEVKAL